MLSLLTVDLQRKRRPEAKILTQLAVQVCLIIFLHPISMFAICTDFRTEVDCGARGCCTRIHSL